MFFWDTVEVKRQVFNETMLECFCAFDQREQYLPMT